MDEAEAQARLRAAAGRHSASRVRYERARDELADVIREVIPPLRQADVARATGYTRERVRQILDEGDK